MISGPHGDLCGRFYEIAVVMANCLWKIVVTQVFGIGQTKVQEDVFQSVRAQFDRTLGRALHQAGCLKLRRFGPS